MPSPDLINAVKYASEELVLDAGARRIGNTEKVWPFIVGSSKIIDFNARNFIKRLNGKQPSSTEVNELADYLALSTCCHALDGWRYLSQSALSLLRGGRNIALHLAYYAELRAALSILACSGIGIVNLTHFGLTNSGTVNWFSGNTHEVAWDALTQWAQSHSFALSVVKSFRALDIDGEEWAEACRAKQNLDAIVRNWLDNWSIDLKYLKFDKGMRNEASYNPDLRINAFSPLSIAELRFVRDANLACSPIGQIQLGSLDLRVIYSLCESARKLNGFGERDFWLEVHSWLLNEKRLTDSEANGIIEEIKKAPKTPGGKLISTADKTKKTLEGVFSRAFLLLRLASALKRKQWQQMRIRASGGVLNWHQIILANYGENTHLWDSSTRPTDYTTLDDDQSSAQDDMNNWLRTITAFNPYFMWKQQQETLLKLCQFERVGIIAATL